jgi:RND family efflux transporter MFP subunit
MPDPERGSLRDALTALRIERGPRPRRARPRWLPPAVGAGVALVFALAAWVGYRLTLGAAPVVTVAFASRSGAESATAASVLTGTGYIVTGDRYISLGVRVPGRVAAYLVEEGQSVEAGQALVRLDDRQYAASLREARASRRVAEANVELRRKELARLRELRVQEFASQAQLDVKQNELDVAQAELERLRARVAQLELDVEETVVRAPASGVVLEKFKEVGEMAVPGGFAGSGEVIRIANLEDLRAEIDINEMDLARVRMGQPAQIVPDAYPDRRYAARVVKIYPQINRQKGTLRLEVRVEKADPLLRPDMSVRIEFFAEEPRAAGGSEAVVLAPRDAVRSDASGSYVWTIVEQRARRQPIETDGRTQGDRVVVTRGLSGGEALVVGDAAGLSEGQRVEIRP